MGLPRESIRRILVRANNWIGDVVMISPSLRALRHGYPDARIDVVARPSVASCFEGHPYVDHVVVHDPGGAHRGLAGFRRFTAELGRSRYDLAVLFQKAFGAALMAWMAGVPRRVGFDTDRRGPLLTHPVRETPELRRIHHVEYFLRVAMAAGGEPGDPPRPVLFHLDEADRAFARAFHERTGADRFRLLAAVATGCSKRPRAWHPSRFAELARRLVDAQGAGILVLGGPGDRADADIVLRAAGEAGIDAVGTTTVRQLGALIERCGLFIGNDSGPMHVAAALDVPVLAIFGPGVPAKTGPWMPSDRRAVVTNAFHCAPCRQDFFRECAPSAALEPACIETVSVDQAATALTGLLRRVVVPAGPAGSGAAPSS